MQGDLGIPSRIGAVALVHAPCPSLFKGKQREVFASAELEASRMPWPLEIGWPLAGGQAERVLSALSLRKLFDFVNLYSMQKGVAAIKPAYSCSQGVPERGTGSRLSAVGWQKSQQRVGSKENSFLLGEGTI